ncbi:capsule biosynthesis protein [Falsiroseomonas sp. HW251]|uniref:capsule biosynthesis protein n=1 Tax=Falsiroseomonas sp. HW251 TaxID=3390998 RepID=UPI003D31F671
MTSSPDPAGRRSFLFLQGPITPFFAEVAAGLVARGHATHRINLNLGDRLFWRGGPQPMVDYRGRPEDWPGFIETYLDRHGVTDIVLLGEQRAYHRAAIAAAQARGIAVTVTDFGYFRPDWITLERDGMGGDSRFPRDPAAIRELAAGLPRADLEERLKDDFPRQARWDVAYHVLSLLPWPFPHYRSHHLHHPFATYAGIGRRLLRRRAERAEGERALSRVKDHPYWVFAMQMENDFSLRAYSRYRDMDTPVAEAVRSFARHAPPDGHLIVKVHPLDPCLKRWHRRLPAIAEAAGAVHRVHVAHHGPLDPMLAGARGMVTVNSTVGLRAVVLGCPAKALGQAVWDVPGLAHQGALDGFWTEAAPPESSLREDFLAALQATTQLRGVFYAPEGRAVAVAATVERLHAGTVGVPARAAAAEPVPAG